MWLTSFEPTCPYVYIPCVDECHLRSDRLWGKVHWMQTSACLLGSMKHSSLLCPRSLSYWPSAPWMKSYFPTLSPLHMPFSLLGAQPFLSLCRITQMKCYLLREVLSYQPALLSEDSFVYSYSHCHPLLMLLLLLSDIQLFIIHLLSSTVKSTRTGTKSVMAIAVSPAPGSVMSSIALDTSVKWVVAEVEVPLSWR